MAQNVYLDSYYAVGNREDLINIITNISPEETVFMSRIGKTTATLRVHEWLTETLQAANSGNAVLEGATAAYASSDVTPRTRVSNHTQILRKTFSVSYSQDRFDKAGISGTEFDHQRMLKTKELARDMNSALINQASASGTSAVARTLNGMLAAITTNTGSANSLPLDEANFNTVLQNIWTQGGAPNAVYVGGFNKRTISGWTSPLNRNIDAAGKKRVVATDVYDSDFGQMSIYLERHMPAAQVAILEEKYWKTAFARPLFFEETGKRGGVREGYVESEITLEYLAENSSGKITGTATA